MVAAGRSRVGEWGHGVEGQASGRGPGCGAAGSRRLSAAASQRAALASSLGGRRRSRGAGTATLVPRHGGTVVRQSLTRGQQALRVPHRRVRHHRLGGADDLGPPAWRSAAPQPHPRRPPALHHHLLHVTTQQHPPSVLLDACGSGAERQGGKFDRPAGRMAAPPAALRRQQAAWQGGSAPTMPRYQTTTWVQDARAGESRHHRERMSSARGRVGRRAAHPARARPRLPSFRRAGSRLCCVRCCARGTCRPFLRYRMRQSAAVTGPR